jgi:hypothetical protein
MRTSAGSRRRRRRWVAYYGAVGPYLGLLAAAQGDHTAAAGHLDAATAQHLRLGAARWADLSRQQQIASSTIRMDATVSPRWRRLVSRLRRPPGARA